MNLVANAMAISTPGLEDKIRRPRQKTDQAALTTARAFLSDAEPLKEEFIKYGMSKDFLDELRTSIERCSKRSANARTIGKREYQPQPQSMSDSRQVESEESTQLNSQKHATR